MNEAFNEHVILGRLAAQCQRYGALWLFEPGDTGADSIELFDRFVSKAAKAHPEALLYFGPREFRRRILNAASEAWSKEYA